MQNRNERRRNPIDEYYRFPWESLLVTPPSPQYERGIICILLLMLSPLLGMVPFVWLLVKADLGVIVATILAIAVVRGKNGDISIPEVVLLLLLAVEAFALPCLLIGSIARAIGWIG